MDLSQFKKALAGVAASAIALTQAGTVFAAYSDVPAGVWYEEPVMAFMDAGYLDASQTRFRGGDNANRAEFVKLVVELNGGILSTPPSVPSFDDVATDAWFYGYFEEAGKEGWVTGDDKCYGEANCMARPAANINRAEAAALIVRSFGLEYNGNAAQFADNPSGQWYTDIIQTAADYCILQGDGGTGAVRPADNMNRAEMVAMLYRAEQNLTYGTDCGNTVQPVDPMVTSLSTISGKVLEVEFSRMLDEEMAEDEGNYAVSGASNLSVTSAELVESDLVRLTLGETTVAGSMYTLSVMGLLTSDGITFDDSVEFAGYSDIVPSNGTLEVSLSASNPAADTVPGGALGVVMLSLDISASAEDDVVVSHLTVLHEGFGNEDDIEGVYAVIDGGRVTRKRTIKNEDQTADIRFTSPLVIPRGQTITVDIVADFITNGSTPRNINGAEHNLVLELASDVRSNAKATAGSFPLRGNTFRIAAVDTGTVTLKYRGITPNEIEVGKTAAIIGKFELKASSTQDESLYSITLENNGSASDGDFQNIAIRKTDNTVVTNTVATSVGDFVTLLFDPPMTILEGDRITLEVIADISDGAGDTISLSLEEDSDLFSVGSLYGYGINGQLYGSQVTIDPNTVANTVTIDAGEFTISINGPAAEQYTRDDDDAVLANIFFESGNEPVDVQTVYMMVEAQTSTSVPVLYNLDGANPALEDVEIRNVATGQTIEGIALADTLADAQGRQVYRFDDFIVENDQEFEFQVDFQDNGPQANGDKFRLYICAIPVNPAANGGNGNTCDFGGRATGTNYVMDIEGLTTGDRILDVRPGTVISGNQHDVTTASLSVAVESLNVTDNSVRNAKNINLLRFRARAGDAEDILLTSATFEAQAGSIINAINYTLWVDTDGDESVDKILETGVSAQSTSTQEVIFDQLVGGGFLVPAEKDVVFEVHADVASQLQASNTLQLQFKGSAASPLGDADLAIEAEEADDGSNLDGAAGEITLSTTASPIYSFAQQGDLFVTKDESLQARQLLGGKISDEILRVNFEARNEDVKVKDLRFSVIGDPSTLTSLELYLDNATAPFGNATSNNCPVGSPSDTFCFTTNDPKLVIPESGDVDVSVRARIKTDTAGGISNRLITVNLNPLVGAFPSVTAEGFESSNPLTINDADGLLEGEIFIGTTVLINNNGPIAGATNSTVMAKIVAITNANPSADNTAVPSGIVPAGQFKFTAASHTNSQNNLNDVVLNDIIFNITATNVAFNANTVKFYNKQNPTIKSNCDTASAPTGAVTVRCRGTATNGLSVDAVNTEIDQGTSKDFVLELEVVTVSSNATLQVSLRNFAEDPNAVLVSAGGSHFNWMDVDGDTSEDFYFVEFPDTVVNSTTYKSS